MRIANLTFSILLSFLTSYGQNALYLEYKGSSKGEDKQTYTLKIYSLDSSSINELTDLEYPARPIKTLYQKTVPDTSFTLYENGTYSKFPDTQLPEYKIEVIGKENINGLSCTKVKLITRGESEQTIWISDQIPSYEKYLMVIVNDIDLTKLSICLKKYNLKGIPVRITFEEDNSLQYDFVKLDIVNIDKSMFSLTNYQESNQLTKEEMLKNNLIDSILFDAMKNAEIEAQKMAEELKVKSEKKKKQ